MITLPQLNGYLGKPISQICPNGFANDNDNHCAHFVAHAMGYKFGVTCLTMVHAQPGAVGATIKVQQIFPQCPAVGTWASRPKTLLSCLAFITRESEVN